MERQSEWDERNAVIYDLRFTACVRTAQTPQPRNLAPPSASVDSPHDWLARVP